MLLSDAIKKPYRAAKQTAAPSVAVSRVQSPAAPQLPLFAQVRGHEACPTPQEEPGRKGNAARGRALLARMVDAAPPRNPVAGYDPSGDYDALWKQGRAKSLTDMRGYDPNEARGEHTGVVAKLGAWQPNLRYFDLIVLNSSAGKDSAAMLVVMKKLAEAQGVLDRIQVVHADLGGAEHDGVRELFEEQARLLGLPSHVVHREVRGVRKDLLDRFVDNLQDKFLAYPSNQREENALGRLQFTRRMNTDTDSVWVRYAGKQERETIREALLGIGFSEKDGAKGDPTRGSFQLRLAGGFPGFGTRYCTSEFKTAEVSKWTTAFVKAHLSDLGRPARILNVLGLRAYESEKRAGKGYDAKGDDTRVRETREWLPIQTLREQDVWDLIRAGGLPYHPIYDLGFQRLSCRLCPLAGDEDVALAALTYPELTQKITDMEDQYGFKFKEKYGLREIIQRALAKNAGLSSVARVARQSLGRR